MPIDSTGAKPRKVPTSTSAVLKEAGVARHPSAIACRASATLLKYTFSLERGLGCPMQFNAIRNFSSMMRPEGQSNPRGFRNPWLLCGLGSWFDSTPHRESWRDVTWDICPTKTLEHSRPQAPIRAIIGTDSSGSQRLHR